MGKKLTTKNRGIKIEAENIRKPGMTKRMNSLFNNIPGKRGQYYTLLKPQNNQYNCNISIIIQAMGHSK